MIIAETFSIFTSMAMITFIAASVFIIRFYEYMRRHKHLLTMPAIIMLGHGPRNTAMVSGLTNNVILSHPLHDADFGYMKVGRRKIQVINPRNQNNIKGIKKFDCKLLLYTFDLSKKSKPISHQIKNFKKTIDILGNIRHIPVAMHGKDKKKLGILRKKFSNLHEVYFPDDMNKIKTSIMSNDLCNVN